MEKIIRFSTPVWMLVVGFLIMGMSGTPVHAGGSCAQPMRLTVGQTASVTIYPNQSNNIRATASASSTRVGSIPPGGNFLVISGPTCNVQDRINWWYIEYNGVRGWTAEGDGRYIYWTRPLNVPSTPPISAPYCGPAPRLYVYAEGRVTPGLPNVVRTAPGTGNNSRIIGEIPGGGQFTVLNGPICARDNRNWWQVNHNGLIGWTAEGEGNTYWVEPINIHACAFGMNPRLVPGQQARVTTFPYLPNTLRQTPGLGSTRVGQIPIGGVFTILDGPQCIDGTAWYRVNYNGRLGWTAEFGWGYYWLEPI